MTLPTNIDSSYPDRSAGDKAHQQDHDSVHAFYNKFDHTTAPAAGNTWVWDATAGVYKPGSGASVVVVRAADLIASNGAPTQTTTMRWPSWLLDSGLTGGVNGVTRIPDDWNSFDLVAFVANAGTGTGAYSLRGDYELASVGDTLGGTFSVGAYADYTAGAQNVIAAHTLRAGVAVSIDRNVMVQIIRGGGNAGDTLANDIALLAVELRKVS